MSPFLLLRRLSSLHSERTLTTFANLARYKSYDASSKIGVGEKTKKFFEEFKLEHQDKYPTNDNALYRYLKDKSVVGYTAPQMQLFRDNFMYRTEGTVTSVVYALAAALKNGDYRSAAAIGQNTFEETGEGDYKKLHLSFLNDSFEMLSEVVFGIAPLLAKDSRNSSLILPSVAHFRDLQYKVVTEGAFPEVIGRLYAHEREADDMLKVVEEAFFKPYAGHFDPEVYKTKVMPYFLAHSDEEHGSFVEERHAKDAEDAALRAIASDPVKGEKEFAKGATEFSESQKAMWEAILNSMRSLEKGVVIVPKPAIILPATTTKAKAAEPAQAKSDELEK